MKDDWGGTGTIEEEEGEEWDILQSSYCRRIKTSIWQTYAFKTILYAKSEASNKTKCRWHELDLIF